MPIIKIPSQPVQYALQVDRLPSLYENGSIIILAAFNPSFACLSSSFQLAKKYFLLRSFAKSQIPSHTLQAFCHYPSDGSKLNRLIFYLTENQHRTSTTAPSSSTPILHRQGKGGPPWLTTLATMALDKC